jgi:hypothetical protein
LWQVNLSSGFWEEKIGLENISNKTLAMDLLRPGWPDEKNGPKCSPTHFLSKMIRIYIYLCREKEAQNCVVLR